MDSFGYAAHFLNLLLFCVVSSMLGTTQTQYTNAQEMFTELGCVSKESIIDIKTDLLT